MKNQELTTVVEMINNIQFIAAAYNQIWTIKVYDTPCGKKTIAFIDERSNEEKLVFHNPDKKMALLMEKIRESSWAQVKEKYLISSDFVDTRVRLCEKEYTCHCHN